MTVTVYSSASYCVDPKLVESESFGKSVRNGNSGPLPETSRNRISRGWGPAVCVLTSPLTSLFDKADSGPPSGLRTNALV